MKKQRKSKPKVDLTGKLYGRLIPLYYIKGGKWHCQCQCENKTELDVDTRNLNSGHTQSCGCLQKEKASFNTINMSNFEDENIKVLERDGSSLTQIARWKCICKHCGNIFTTQGSHLRYGKIKSCGCVHSQNEKFITELLLNNNITFSSQYTFKDLKGINGRRLRFDFAIFKNNKLSHLIEYNGAQHYICPEGKWSEGFETLQIHDKLKYEYCKNNNIRLIVIRYDENYTLKDLL